MVYLDNGATSFPKPLSVVEEVKAFMTEVGGNAGRSGHKRAMEAAERVFECREKTGNFFGAQDVESIFFGLNTTHVLNTVIKGILRAGDHVIISDIEHNSVYRPIYRLASEGKISYDIFSTVFDGKKKSDREILKGVEGLIRENTRMVICTAASNICSVRLPLKNIGRLCRDNGIIFAVDGAQGAGHEIINVTDMNIDALCVPAHKGLLGPQGCGVGILGESLNDLMMDTIIEGGNGVDSLIGEMSVGLPERLEAGTLPTPAICGLTRGIEAVEDIGIEKIKEKERGLFTFCRDALETVKGVKIYLREEEGAILLFNIDGLPSEYVASELDRRGICVRGGYHCSALGHSALGTLDRGGVRVSFSIYNKKRDVEKLWRAVSQIAKQNI